MTVSTNMTPSSPIRSTTMKPFARRSSATGSTKFRISAALFNESWRLSTSDEIRKARDQVLGYKAMSNTQYVSAEQRAQRCHNLVSEALNVMQGEESDFTASSSPAVTAAAPQQTASQSPAPVDLGYGDDSTNEDLGYGPSRSASVPTSPQATFGSNKRRFQRRCSVTEFSL